MQTNNSSTSWQHCASEYVCIAVIITSRNTRRGGGGCGETKSAYGHNNTRKPRWCTGKTHRNAYTYLSVRTETRDYRRLKLMASEWKKKKIEDGSGGGRWRPTSARNLYDRKRLYSRRSEFIAIDYSYCLSFVTEQRHEYL